MAAGLSPSLSVSFSPRSRTGAGKPKEAMNIDIRRVTMDEFEDYVASMQRGFSEHVDEQDREIYRGLFKHERAFAAYDGELIVGTTSTIPFRMTIPGGTALPLAGVTAVTVQPTHRRRGILTQMMRHQLGDAREHGQPLAALWASETSIYGRFGFGMAVQLERWRIDRSQTAFEHRPEATGRVRFVDKDEALRLYPEVMNRVCEQRAGMIPLEKPLWEAHLHDLPRWRDGASAYFHAVYEVDGRADGYVMYRVKQDWTSGVPPTLRVAELVAVTDAAHAALWRFVLDIDLIGHIEAAGRPPDDAVAWMLTDSRRLERRVYDGMWLRIVDVAAALSARGYSQPGSVVLQVEDKFLPANGGRFALAAGPGGAECNPTRRKPDVTLSASDLAAIYLGGVSVGTLARAGRVREEKAGGLARADAMFATDRAPWCVVDF